MSNKYYTAEDISAMRRIMPEFWGRDNSQHENSRPDTNQVEAMLQTYVLAQVGAKDLQRLLDHRIYLESEAYQKWEDEHEHDWGPWLTVNVRGTTWYSGDGRRYVRCYCIDDKCQAYLDESRWPDPPKSKEDEVHIPKWKKVMGR